MPHISLKYPVLYAVAVKCSTRHTWSPVWRPPLMEKLLRGNIGVQPDICHYKAVLYAAFLESSLMPATAWLSSTRQTWSPTWCPPLLGCPLRDKLGVQRDVRHCRVILYAVATTWADWFAGQWRSCLPAISIYGRRIKCIFFGCWTEWVASKMIGVLV